MSNSLVRRAFIPLIAALALLLAQAGQALPPPENAISDVFVSRTFFNPTLGQTIGISFNLDRSGSLTVLILDRDGYLVRRLVSGQTVRPGKRAFRWDGKDDHGNVVPNEAYSIKIDLSSAGGTDTYFPASRPGQEVSTHIKYYDRRSGIVSYTLPAPSRVHIQAGSATVDSVTKRTSGPVLKTIVNREPRVAGAVIEAWNGFDESGTIYVPDLPNFVMALAASELPENTIITIGNRAVTFLEAARKRAGPSLLPPPTVDHRHHRGLDAFEDAAPRMRIEPTNASWSGGERLWKLSGRSVRIEASLDGPTAAAFTRQPARLMLFVDRVRVRQVSAPTEVTTVDLSAASLKPGIHIVALNWVSDYGPVAVGSFRLKVGSASSKL